MGLQGKLAEEKPGISLDYLRAVVPIITLLLHHSAHIACTMVQSHKFSSYISSKFSQTLQGLGRNG